MKQYQQGSAFVQEIVQQAGMAGFNRVWTSPATLPTKEEFTHPASWLERVDSGAPTAG
jgi:uncharacterized protein (DUF2342 family)